MTYPWAHLIDAAFDRFASKLDTSRGPEGCWPWLGGRSRGKGNREWYGSFRVGRWTVRAHIFAAAAAGEATPGLHRDHLCAMCLCCNPLHLEEVDGTENSRRRWRSTPGWKKAA